MTDGTVAYSLREACRIIGLGPATVAALVQARVVEPSASRSTAVGTTSDGSLVFSFADLRALRSLAALPREILRRCLRDGKAALLKPAGGRRLRALGTRLVIVEPDGRLWDAATGQCVLPLEAEEAAMSHVARVLVSPRWERPTAEVQEAARPHDGPNFAAEAQTPDYFEQALALEDSDPAAAVELYYEALYADPGHEDAYLNLGVLLQSQGDLAHARTVYRAGLMRLPESALLHFNLGVVLQVLGAYFEAARHYEKVLDLAPGLADAHQNLALCCIEVGDSQAAIRHANAARRLKEQCD